MRRTTDIIFGLASQALLHRAMEGRPSAATFKVYLETADDDDSEVEFSGTGTVDSVNTTLASAAGTGQDDRTALTLTSGSGVLTGWRYLLSQNGLREWVEVASVSGASVVARAPLQNAYTASATFASTYVSAAVPDAWAADEDNLSDAGDPTPDYRVRWALTIDGASYIAYTFFDLVRGAIGHSLTMQDMEARFWDLLDEIPTDHRTDQGARILDAAWEDVQGDLAAIRVNDAALRDAQIVDQLLIHRVRLTFAENGHHPPAFTATDYLSYAADSYRRYYEQHFKMSSTIAMARGTSAGATRTPAPAMMRK